MAITRVRLWQEGRRPAQLSLPQRRAGAHGLLIFFALCLKAVLRHVSRGCPVVGPVIRMALTDAFLCQTSGSLFPTLAQALNMLCLQQTLFALFRCFSFRTHGFRCFCFCTHGSFMV